MLENSNLNEKILENNNNNFFNSNQKNSFINSNNNQSKKSSKKNTSNLHLKEIKRNSLIDIKILNNKNNSFFYFLLKYYSKNISFFINLNVIWRMPYYFIDNKGAIFFIPFIIFFITLGIPLFTIENTFSFILKINLNEIFKFKSFQYLIFFIIFIINVYYVNIISYFLQFSFLSLKRNLLWKINLNDNNVKNKLFHIKYYKELIINYDFINNSNKFYFENLGKINKYNFICYFLTWVFIFLILNSKYKLNKNIKYVLNLIPVLFIIILLIHSLYLPYGLNEGFLYFLIPNFKEIFNFKIWLFSINQCLFLLNIGYINNLLNDNKKIQINNNKNNNSFFNNYIKLNNENNNYNIYKHSSIKAFSIVLISILYTLLNSFYNGFISYQMNIKILDFVPFDNFLYPLFITYQISLGSFKHCNLFSFIFFISNFYILIKIQIIIINNLIYFIKLENIFKNNNYFYNNINIIFCFISFLFGIIFVTNNGYILIKYLDKYITLIPILFIIVFELYFCINKVKIHNLIEIIANKTGFIFPGYVFFSLNYIAPIFILFFFILSFIYHLINLSSNFIIFLIQWIITIGPALIIIFEIVKNKINERGFDYNQKKYFVNDNEINSENSKNIIFDMNKIEMEKIN